MSFIAGNYLATFGAAALGQIADGYEMDEPGLGQVDPISGDLFGPGAMQDGVTQGGDMFINFVLMEYNATAVRALITPGSAGTPGIGTQPGLLMSSLAAALVLTKVAGTGALPATTRTFTYAIIAPNHRVQYALANRKRFIPIRMQIIPYINGSTRTYYIDV